MGSGANSGSGSGANTAAANTYVGNYTGRRNASGVGNVALGYYALDGVTSNNNSYNTIYVYWIPCNINIYDLDVISKCKKMGEVLKGNFIKGVRQ